jgi:hypothetical protein
MIVPKKCTESIKLRQSTSQQKSETGNKTKSELSWRNLLRNRPKIR